MIIGGKPLNVTSITFFFTSSSCGINPVLSESQIRARWYDNGDSAPVTASLQRYHRVCSYNKLGFYPDRNLVFGPIDVPVSCISNLPGGMASPRNGTEGHGVGVGRRRGEKV